MIVMKFGGSSVESGAAMERVASIVKQRLAQKPIVVVSAMGKTTNRLLEMAKLAAAGSRPQAEEKLEELRLYTLEQALLSSREEDAYELRQFIDLHFSELGAFLDELTQIGEFPPQYVDLVSSYGERLSSKIVTMVFRKQGIDSVHIDAREVLITDRRHTQAQPLFPRTYAKCEGILKPLAQLGKVPVLGGFIGQTADGFTTTLGRGGSDYSASIFGAGCGVEEIQIWTDVDGMLTCDPRILPGGHRVKLISSAEAAELAYFGAKVLHPATVQPAIEKKIPVLILNSRNPSNPGTRIVADEVRCQNVFKSIACKREVALINIQSLRMLMAHGFLRRIFEIFDRYETPVDMVATSEVSVSLTVDKLVHLEAIRAELEKFSQVQIDQSQAIICLVGDNVKKTPGIPGRVFGALAPFDIHMISQGASQLNISIVVNDADLQKAVEALHREFFSELDTLVFEEAAVSAVN